MTMTPIPNPQFPFNPSANKVAKDDDCRRQSGQKLFLAVIGSASNLFSLRHRANSRHAPSFLPLTGVSAPPTLVPLYLSFIYTCICICWMCVVINVLKSDLTSSFKWHDTWAKGICNANGFRLAPESKIQG